MSCRCGQDAHVHRAPTPESHRGNWLEATVTLVRGDCSAVVRPASLRAGHVSGALCVSLADLWTASRLSGNPDAIELDFVGADGFRPSRNGFPPLPGTMLERGYLQLETGRLEWDGSAGLPCGYRVKGVTMILALDPTGPHAGLSWWA